MSSPTGTGLSLRGLEREDYKSLARGVIAQVKEDDVPSLAAGVSFRIFLSLFPALFAAVAAFRLVASPGDIVALVAGLDFLPDEAQALIQQPLMEFVQEGAAGETFAVVAGILGGLWAASSAAVMLAKALTRIIGAAETRKFVAQRLTGVVIALAIFLALIAVVFLLVAGASVQAWLIDELMLAAEAEAGIALALTIGRYVLAVLVIVVLFAFVYWIGPDREARPPFQWLTPGAVLGVVGWLVLSLLFSFYTQTAGAADNPAYAGLGGVIVLLLWLQLSMTVVLVGAELNAELRRLTATRLVTGADLHTGTRAGDPRRMPEERGLSGAGADQPGPQDGRGRQVAIGALSVALAVTLMRRLLRSG